MLFSSSEFVLAFLPIVVAAFYGVSRFGHRAATMALLLTASFAFYAYWKPVYLLLFLASLIFNYGCGRAIAARAASERKFLLACGVGANIGVLFHFKYTDFMIGTLNWGLGTDVPLQSIILPLGISFYTFQQISFLVDAYYGRTSFPTLAEYCLVVSFFPHLIAGPILHPNEIVPQLRERNCLTFDFENFMVGIGLFTIGLFKKIHLADALAGYVSPVFSFADTGGQVTFAEAWAGALAYTLQLYFDFSGYSDMAIGLALLFGIRLPQNFNSPYKARSIIEFWRRWHMTLSRFLLTYVYIPLGGNRHGRFRRYINLGVTMLLGGLWHGASWTFVLWGGLHGLFLMVNHAWRSLRGAVVEESSVASRLGTQALTRLCVVSAWVLFRAETFSGAGRILSAMYGLEGLALPSALQPWLGSGAGIGLEFDGMFRHGLTYWPSGLVMIAVGWGIALFAPNSHELMTWCRARLSDRTPGMRSAAAICGWLGLVAGAGTAASLLFLNKNSEFLYFQF